MTVLPFDTDPEALVRQRVAALQRGEFGLVYDSYHSDSPFRRQFPDRDEYIAFARKEIAGRIRIERFRVLRRRCAGEKCELIFHQLVRSESGFQESFELALLLREDGRWRYLGSSRLDRSLYRGAVEQLDFADFDRSGVVFF